MKHLLTTLLFFPLLGLGQFNNIGAGLNLVIVTEIDSTGTIIQYYCHSGKEYPINEYYVEEIKYEAKENEIIIIPYL